MGAKHSRDEVEAYGSSELSDKSQEVKCNCFVTETIRTHDVDGGSAYELKQMRDDEPEEFKAVLQEYSSAASKQMYIRAGLKKLPEKKLDAGVGEVKSAAEPAVKDDVATRDRGGSESTEVTTALHEWSANDVATLIRGLGSGPKYAQIADAVCAVGMDGEMMAIQVGASATIDALLQHLKEGHDFLSGLMLEKLRNA